MATFPIENVISACIPLPVCIINKQGKVLCASNKINEVFLYDRIVDGDFFTLTGVKTLDLYDAVETKIFPVIDRNDKKFKLVAQLVDESEDSNLAVFFNDVTALEDLKDKYRNERLCVAKIEIDNFEELMDNMPADESLSLSNEIDKIIRKWGEKSNASVVRNSNDTYMLTFEYQHLEKLKESKFELLDEVRDLETNADFPASLSIGVGVDGKTPAETAELASEALQLALGRGGDQAVVKRDMKIEYFGGTLQTVEKRNKGKSRMVGHALKQLISQSKKIFVMGHVNPDMDCFGAALGVVRICSLFDNDPYIVIDNYKEALSIAFKAAKDSEDYKFVTSEKALSLVDKDSLVIVVDTHRPNIVQCPELLEVCDRVVVIDHHRRVEDFIENPILAYVETYASSTCELVTEILQYATNKKSLTKLEAETLLAGITVDTNGFTVKAGVRTFEAAAWLRRQGADPTEVSRFFQEDKESYIIKTKTLADARFYDEGIAVSVCETPHSDEQVICAQVANNLLTVRGVKASFVAGINGEGRTVVSARSLGSVNVQTIMEKFNGGGHLTTAATQTDTPPEEIIEQILDIMEVKR
ncbi:MAG: DHH family phosphoesterase [Firmicutes bacterium]|nr:DHH family phosphoesterase [Bacillota bacterium]